MPKGQRCCQKRRNISTGQIGNFNGGPIGRNCNWILIGMQAHRQKDSPSRDRCHSHSYEIFYILLKIRSRSYFSSVFAQLRIPFHQGQSGISPTHIFLNLHGCRSLGTTEQLSFQTGFLCF